MSEPTDFPDISESTDDFQELSESADFQEIEESTAYQEVSEATNSVNFSGRHCAYCLKFLPSGTEILCDKCNRRAYCSEECRLTDWIPGKGSQGHQNWCQLGCCEEDIDWEVKPIDGKGFGVVAKRPISSRSRIMVEAVRSISFPAVKNLAPIGARMKRKLQVNMVRSHFSVVGSIFLRLSRLNHNCHPNAEHFEEIDMYVSVVVASRDIDPGEEITISYVYQESADGDASPREIRQKLWDQWKIICERDCYCRNVEMFDLKMQCWDLKELMIDSRENGDAEGAMAVIEKLLDKADALHLNLLERANLLFEGYEIGISTKATMDRAIEYMKRAVEIRAAICHPESSGLHAWMKLQKDPSLHKSHLYLEDSDSSDADTI